MHLKHLLTGLAVLSSLVAAAPAQDAKAAADKGAQKQDQNKDQNKNGGKNNGKNNNNNNKNNNKNNGDVTIVQNIIKPNIIVVQENLDKINQLQRQNERELAALVQSQLALATQLQTVKDNIRINHFKAQFPQANTIIVTVTGLVDNRAGGQQNKRYLVNQLLADNGQPGKQALVMVTDPTPMEISTQQAASAQSDTFGATRVALDANPNAAANNTDDTVKAAAVPGTDDTDTTLKIAAFDQAAPFGQIGQSIILPAGTQAPQLSLSIPDPAAIILPNQQGLFVENAATFLSDCASSAANAANGNPALAGAAATLFSSFQQIAAAQLAGLSGLGVFNNSGQAGQPLGAIAVGANQGQPLAAAPPVAAPPPPAAAPPAQVATPPQGQAGQPLGAIAVGANQGQPASQPAAAAPPPSANAAAPQPPAAIVNGANQAQPATAASPPQGNAGSGVVIVGSSPGGVLPAAQPPAAIADTANQTPPTSPPPAGQEAGAPAPAPAPAPAAAALAGANQAQPAPPAPAA